MIQASWDSEAQRYVHLAFSGRWTWDELSIAIAHGRQISQGVTHRFYLVVQVMDEVARSHVPSNVFSYANMTYRVSPYVVQTIIVNSNSIGVGIMSIVFRLYPELKNYYVFVPKLEDAERLILLAQEAGKTDSGKTSSV